MSPEAAAAQKLYNEGKKTEAKAALEAMAKKDPKNADALFVLGRIAFGEKDYDASVKWLEKAIDQRPNRSTDHMWLGRAYGQKAVQASVFKKPFLASSVKKEMLRPWSWTPNIDASTLPFYITPRDHGSDDKAMQQAAEVRSATRRAICATR